ncbi:MAG: zinc ribbon domain-containing protein [candidate division Zixibacteria bacterium]|nr:zinc ribbon domain-containing protein [candidate division Zixibacteria bacterium]
MPIYEFKCTNCGKVFDELRGLSKRDEEAICPDCKAKAERMVSSFAAGNSSGASASSNCGTGGFS